MQAADPVGVIKAAQERVRKDGGQHENIAARAIEYTQFRETEEKESRRKADEKQTKSK